MNTTNSIVLFLTTGRSGTQWLANTLQQFYADRAVICHEPIGYAYNPKKYLRAFDKIGEQGAIPSISNHLARIHLATKDKAYIETGFPCYSAIPLFVNQFQCQVKIVHLTRHPISTSISLTTHDVYEREDCLDSLSLDPFDEGVSQKYLAEKWPSMHVYEKCLFWWTEIHLYAVEIEGRYPSIPYLRIKYEDLLSQNFEVLWQLLDFLGLPKNDGVAQSIGRFDDKYRYRTNKVDWKLIYNYPETIRIAQQLGYNLNYNQKFDQLESILSRRYFI